MYIHHFHLLILIAILTKMILGTIYVADSQANAVFSLPSATMQPRVPELVVALHGAFGLALVSGDDPGEYCLKCVNLCA